MDGYQRKHVTNVDQHPFGRLYFDAGLRFLFSYQHELASQCFLTAVQYAPYTALAHGLIALCHAPNYNFKGAAYYGSTLHAPEVRLPDHMCTFPSQILADRHSQLALLIVEEIKRQNQQLMKQNKKTKNNNRSGNRKKKTNSNHPAGSTTLLQQQYQPDLISDVEAQFLKAIRLLTGRPGIDATASKELVERPYANAMRRLHEQFPDDPEIAYHFAEALMVPQAWQLYEYPSGQPVSEHVVEVGDVLLRALQKNPHHAGLSHLFVHLSEMSSTPEQALEYCDVLRNSRSGHLHHMPTHIDVLVGEYQRCVESNLEAIVADRHLMELSPHTAGPESFYFGYITHNYHMAVYGCILGGMEAKAMEIAQELDAILAEDLLAKLPNLANYLESYTALDVHILVRFGRWNQILNNLKMPRDPSLMLFRMATIYYARALSYAMLDDGSNGYLELAKLEADQFDEFRRRHADALQNRILHNNTVADLLTVDSVMMRGELAYRSHQYEDGLALLRQAVQLQDELNYDEPWGKMQPVRHALGGLLLEQGQLEEAEDVFRKDLDFHPRNPWALVGLIQCLQKRATTLTASSCCGDCNDSEIPKLQEELRKQRLMKWADFDIVVACECCAHPAT